MNNMDSAVADMAAIAKREEGRKELVESGLKGGKLVEKIFADAENDGYFTLGIGKLEQVTVAIRNEPALTEKFRPKIEMFLRREQTFTAIDRYKKYRSLGQDKTLPNDGEVDKKKALLDDVLNKPGDEQVIETLEEVQRLQLDAKSHDNRRATAWYEQLSEQIKRLLEFRKIMRSDADNNGGKS